MVFTDNFYTRHVLGAALKLASDGEVKLIGTCRFNFIDAINRVRVKEALEVLKDKPRGDWRLVRAYDKPADWDTRRENYQENHPESCVHENAGYCIWVDKKPVIFYSNDLFLTPMEGVNGPESAITIMAVHGLAKIDRWVGNEYLHRTTFMPPALVIAYNRFMNAVDRVDQHRAANPIQRKESRI